MPKTYNNGKKGEKEDFSWKSVRIKKEFFYIFNFLKYHCILNNIDDELIFEKIIIYGLDNIKNSNVYYNFAYSNEKRLVKSFYISNETFKAFEELYEEFKQSNKIFKSELYELCIYLYVLNNFSKIEKNMVMFDKTDFGIKTLDIND